VEGHPFIVFVIRGRIGRRFGVWHLLWRGSPINANCCVYQSVETFEGDLVSVLIYDF